MKKRFYVADFQTFINVNKLTQKKVSDYLGVSTAFINQIMKGKCDLPDEQLQKLRESNWDTSMFDSTYNTGVIINSGKEVNNNHIDNRQYYSDSPDVLRKQIEDLERTIAERERLLAEKEERIKEKDSQIKEKDSQIKEKDSQINTLLSILKK